MCVVGRQLQRLRSSLCTEQHRHWLLVTQWGRCVAHSLIRIHALNEIRVSYAQVSFDSQGYIFKSTQIHTIIEITTNHRTNVVNKPEIVYSCAVGLCGRGFLQFSANLQVNAATLTYNAACSKIFMKFVAASRSAGTRSYSFSMTSFSLQCKRSVSNH